MDVVTGVDPGGQESAGGSGGQSEERPTGVGGQKRGAPKKKQASLKGWPAAHLSPVPDEALRRGDGVLVREFIAAKGKITKDSVAGRTGDQLRLRGWQEALVDHVFARRDDGKRLHRVHLVGLPRKQGKTALAAVIALYGLTMEGQGAEVYSCAADKDQSKLVFGAAKRMVELDEELSARLTLYRDTIEDKATGSFYRALSSEAYTKEGLSPTMVVYDELHAAPNRDLFDVMSLAMGARPEPLLLAITTAGQRSDSTGKDSVAFSLYQYGRRVASGEQADPSFGFAWWEAPADADHRDPNSWPVANPALGDLTDAEDYASALLRTPEAEFRTKRMNQWINSATSWLPSGAWDALHQDRVLADGEQVVLAFDGSFSGDCTAIVACTMDGFIQPVALWERPLDDPHWQVPMDEVEARMYDLCKKYQVREISADPYRWARTLQKWETDGLPVVIYPQNPSRMVPACAAFYEAVTQETLSHNGDAALSRHLDNCSVKIDRFGPRIVKEHRGSPRKIDLGVCAVMSYDRARYHAQAPAAPKAAEFITL